MRAKILFLTLLSAVVMAGCSNDNDDDYKLKVEPETLIIGQKGGTAVVTTSGFTSCDIVFDTDNKNSEWDTINRGYNNSYECDWFTVFVDDDWCDFNFEFKENTSTKQRSVTFILMYGDFANRFTVIQKGTK